MRTEGDIVAICNNVGTKLVSYTYDAWGNHTEEYFNSGATVTAVKNNPLRYRGYYYDTDLGLYYLQSRYYDSATGRFINADGYISTGTGILGYNMYAYCNNNPVMYVDPSGEFLEITIPCALLLTALLLVTTALLTTVETTLPQAKVNTLSAIKTLDDAKIESKDETVTVSPPNQRAYFTKNPYDFNPNGLIRKEYPGSYNGKIIKWIDPVTKNTIFEWNEDFKEGPHYHILVNNKHVGDHKKAGESVPEPYNSIYFGVIR